MGILLSTAATTTQPAEPMIVQILLIGLIIAKVIFLAVLLFSMFYSFHIKENGNYEKVVRILDISTNLENIFLVIILTLELALIWLSNQPNQHVFDSISWIWLTLIHIFDIYMKQQKRKKEGINKTDLGVDE